MKKNGMNERMNEMRKITTKQTKHKYLNLLNRQAEKKMSILYMYEHGKLSRSST